MSAQGLGDSAVCKILHAEDVKADGVEVKNAIIMNEGSLLLGEGASIACKNLEVAGTGANVSFENLPAVAGVAGTLYNNGDGIVRVSP